MPYYTLSQEDLQKSLSFDPSELIEKSAEGVFDTNKKTLIIGLGGMGVRTLCEIKKSLRDRVGLPSDDMIRFLAIDSDKHDLIRALETGLLSKDELFLLYNESILPAIRDAYSAKKDDTLRALRMILPPPSAGFHPHLCASGACQTRLAGRASLMEPTLFHALIDKLNSAIRAFHDFQNYSLHVHMISGLCGGTGSGIIVDVPYIMRKILLDLGLSRIHAQFFGHLYLPNVDADSFRETLPLEQIENMCANGYAALKEIDYFMNIGQTGESFEAVYPGWGSCTFKEPIFTSCLLHGGKHPNRTNKHDPRAEAVQSCVGSLLQDLISEFYDRDRNERPISIWDCFASQTFQDGLTGTIRQLVCSDLCFHKSASFLYNIFDRASLFFPADAIKAYAISTVTEKAVARLQTQADAVTQQDVDDFSKNLIAPEDFMRSTLGFFSNQIYHCFESIPWSKRVILDRYEFDLRLRGEMNRCLAEFDSNHKLSSDAITFARIKADSIFQDPKKGPFFLAKLLHGSDTVTGYYARMKQYAQIAHAKITEAESFLSEAIPKLEQLTETMLRFLGFTRERLETYQELAHSIYLKMLEIKLLEKLAQEYYHPYDESSLCYRMKQMLDTDYLYFADILTRIGESMKSLSDDCRKNLYPENAESGNILGFRKEACMKPLTDSVDHTIRTVETLEESEIVKFGSSLAASIVGNRDSWTLYDSRIANSDLKKNLRDFANGYPLFRDVLSRDLPAYFEEAYANCDEATRQEVANFLLTHLKARSAPLFHYPKDFDQDAISRLHYEYATLPTGIGEDWAAPIRAELPEDHQRHLIHTSDNNTITYHQIYFRIPLWLHADLATYEKAYYRYHRVGRHINENPNLLPPYKHYPPLIPREQYFRFTGKDGTRYENPAEDDFLHELRSLITFCLENGIIHLDEYGDRYVVSLIEAPPPLDPSDDAVTAFVRNYCEAKENRDHTGTLRLGAHLYGAMLDHFGRKSLSINPVGIWDVSPDCEENLPIIIRKQMKLFGELQAAMHNFKAILTLTMDC